MSEFAKIKREVIGDIWTSNESYKNLLAICSFGPRYAGTQSEIEAGDYILQKFREYGLDDVHAEEFEDFGWRGIEGKAWITQPIQKEIGVLSFMNSTPTPPNGIEGEVIFIGPCATDVLELNKDAMKDKVVLTSDYWPYGPINATNRATEFGAKALVFMNMCSGAGPIIEECQAGRLSRIPVAGISYEDGERIKRLLVDGKVRVKLYLKNEVGKAKYRNVIATIRGKGPEEVIVGAHFDSPGAGDGAVDDAAGASVVMEVARVLAKHKGQFKRTIRFLCLPAEEPGEFGSIAYRAAHGTELREMATLYVNLDATCVREGIDLIDVADVASIAPLKKILDELGFTTMNYAATYSNNYGDGFAFLLEGVPTVWPRIDYENRPEAKVYAVVHCPSDTIDKVNPKVMKESAMIGAWIALHAANSERPFAKRRTREEVQKLVDKHYGDILRIEAREWLLGPIEKKSADWK